MKTFASLFTGGGLADIGAINAGYELLWGVEIDATIAAVANANLPHRERVYAESVVCIDWAKMTRPDHLHMSPPCQDFSVAKTSGKVGNDNDAIADACIEALAALQPSTVTLENVEGYRKAPGFQRIVDHLWGSGYWVNVDVLNSADFGVPQTRRRLILRAVQGGFPGPLPEPVKPWRGWYEAIEDLIPGLPETQFAAWQLERLPVSFILGNGTYSAPIPSQRPAQTITSNDNQTGVRAYLVSDKGSESQELTGRELQAPSFSVVGGNGSGGLKATFIESPIETDESREQFEYEEGLRWAEEDLAKAPKLKGRVVRMTPRCLARFQSVPDWYTLPEKTALACKIFGNGIPCLMMQRVMEAF
jgi:DNA (cytosine-5)-methyltransferase 1